MSKAVSFLIDEDVYEKFCLAMSISKDSEEEAIEMCMRWYIAKTFEKASYEYNPKTISKPTEVNNDYYGKAIQRIPIWALKTEQYNHKIIKAYFAAVDIAGEATVTMMEHLCSEKENPELYVPTFKNNYSQMKIDGAKSHGKVFEDDGENVWLWSEIKDTLLKYKSSFYSEEDKRE
ncbi:hypothetical protein SAMN05660462_01898 [Proteiniborus ethanoligenes]|uniref:Uncharacterized protein n=1 Tax=Proteiniborus ethanoligenes TaxID=415015 RepID=A0A1H3QEQ2_9FIRM|nr:hypothetical protein [Proteiniborus ethanoligenes]SDZ11743.1 hypothetical protein SAMN05660462_01898 [Proteiniborus ethanoligenes]